MDKKLEQFLNKKLHKYLDDSEILHEMRIRKRWLLSFYGAISAKVLAAFFTFPDSFFSLESFSNDFFIHMVFILPFFFTFSGLAACINMLLTYHYSYRRKRTFWLLFTLAAIPLMIAHDIFFTTWRGAATLGYLCVDILYWRHCRHLYKLNIKRQLQAKELLKKETTLLAT
jgi:hypothetical protein